MKFFKVLSDDETVKSRCIKYTIKIFAERASPLSEVYNKSLEFCFLSSDGLDTQTIVENYDKYTLKMCT